MRKKIGDMLVEEEIISRQQLEEALREQKKDKNSKLGDILKEKGYLTEENLAQVLSSQLRIPFISLKGIRLDEKMKNLLPLSVLKQYKMIPLAYSTGDANHVQVAMADPMDMRASDDFYLITSMLIEPVIALESEINQVLEKKFGDSEAMLAAKRYEQQQKEESTDAALVETEALSVENSPIVQLVKAIVEQACRQRASDIHIEALEEKARVRFRIDGTLYQKYLYDANMLAAIIARIKIIGGMDISEKRKPQDGRATMVVDLREYDIRISILPTVYGEKCVMRLAQKSLMNRNKSELGLKEEQLEIFDNILSNPNGIVLVTGPTGSGKSTTLYTALSELNSDEVNIITVEDPVEAKIDGINQVNVNTKADLTFATVLRSILRQDPDIIMIGEIRDTQTAKIAVQASITGHLVVSTLHTNSSASTVTRMLDMGVESFLLADSMVGIIAQRLVRRLCPECRMAYEASEEEQSYLGLDGEPQVTLYKACGCNACNGTGYKGRMGVYEIMPVTPALKHIISHAGTTEEIKRVALEEGMTTLHQNARELVLDGITTFSELLKVSMEE